MKRRLGKHLARALVLGLTALGLSAPVWAHQPVMDMAPRWEDGYGFQIRHEWRASDTLLDGDSEVENPFGRKKRVNTTWLEGIYTFKREVRLSLKVPWVDQSRTVVQNGVPVRQTGSGLGDIIIGVPLKSYTNLADVTWNIAFTPSLRLPTGSTAADFPVGDGSTDFGYSFSYSHEAAGLYQYYDLFGWVNTRGKKGIAQGDEVGLDVNLGLHPYHDNLTNSGVFVMGDASARYEDVGVDAGGTTGGTRVSVGPVLVLYRQGTMFRAEFKVPAYEKLKGTQVSRGPEVNVGIGFVF